MGRKKTLQGEYRSVGFRMPVPTWDVLSAYAEARGVDVSAVLNGLVADALPGMRRYLSDPDGDRVFALYRQTHLALAESLGGEARADAEAVLAGVERCLAAGGDPREELARWRRETGRDDWADGVEAMLRFRERLGQPPTSTGGKTDE